MKRRDLLKLLALAPVGLAAAELWLPKRSIFLPPAGGWFSIPSMSGAPGLYQWEGEDPPWVREAKQYTIVNESIAAEDIQYGWALIGGMQALGLD